MKLQETNLQECFIGILQYAHLLLSIQSSLLLILNSESQHKELT